MFQALLDKLNQGPKISGDSNEKTTPEFRGSVDVKPEKWFDHYEEIAAAYRL